MTQPVLIQLFKDDFDFEEVVVMEILTNAKSRLETVKEDCDKAVVKIDTLLR